MMEKYILSEMTRRNFSKAVNEIYLASDYNHLQYPGYCKWFYGKNIPRVITGTGEILFYLDGLELVGLAILKRDIEEAKICTFMVREEYQKCGFGKALLERSFDYLGTDKPLITIPTKRLEEFSKIITAYDWQESFRSDEYLSEEVIFNRPKSLVKEQGKKDLVRMDKIII